MAARSQVCSRHTKRHASFSQGGDFGRRERLQMRKVYNLYLAILGHFKFIKNRYISRKITILEIIISIISH